MPQGGQPTSLSAKDEEHIRLGLQGFGVRFLYEYAVDQIQLGAIGVAHYERMYARMRQLLTDFFAEMQQETAVATTTTGKTKTKKKTTKKTETAMFEIMVKQEMTEAAQSERQSHVMDVATTLSHHEM